MRNLPTGAVTIAAAQVILKASVLNFGVHFMLMARFAGVLLTLLLPTAKASVVCEEIVPSALMVVRPATVPLAVGFETVPTTQLGAPRGVLAAGYERTQSVDYVIYRMRLEDCRAMAVANAIATAIATTDYVKLTEFDNTPYRFNLVQNGKYMTADDFDLWLRTNGYYLGRRIDPDAEQVH